MRSPVAATLIYLSAGALWLHSLGARVGDAAWPLLLFSAVLVHALFLRARDAERARGAGAGRLVLDDVPGFAMAVDRHGRIRGWNRALGAACGLDEAWAGRAAGELFAAGDLVRLDGALAGPASFDARVATAGGDGLLCRWTTALAADGAVVLVGLPCEGALAAAQGGREAVLEGMLEAVTDLVAVVVDGRIVELNRSGARILGAAEPATAIGVEWASICRGSGEDNCRLERLDGGNVVCACSSRPILYKGRSALLVQAHDVTELAGARRVAADGVRHAQAVADALAEAVLTVDADGRLRAANRAAETVFGYEAGELPGAALSDLVAQGRRGQNGRRKDGAQFPVEVVTTELRQSRGIEQLVVVRDLSERRASENRLLVAEKVLEATVEGVMVTDARGVIQWVNNAFCKISGFGRDEVIGENASLLKSGFQATDFYKTMWQQIRATGEWQGEIWNRRKDGEAYLEWLTIRAVSDDTGAITNYVGVFSDISRHKRAEETIKHLTYYDGVTRLPNRYLFRDRVAQAIERSQRSGRMVALVMVSLARFKQVNETLGHATGDALLREVAERLVRSVRGQDTVARLRGDTFCCVVSDLINAPDATPVVNRMLEYFGSAFHPNGHELFATASIGISVFPLDGTDVDDLVQKAETAMNRTKDKAESTFQFYTPEMNANNMERLRLETDLRKAVTQGHLVLHYQPKVETVSGRLVGAEALVRWRHPELGMIPPGKFIPIAEDSGLILPVGKWVLQAACLQIREWQAAGLPLVRIAINLSAHQFRQPELVETVVRVLEETGVDSSLIELELTESAVMHNSDIAVRRMLDLHDAGIRLAIDDFGTGYSSLSHLKRFPLDKLKIDRSFIQDLDTSPAGEEIVGAIVAMAHSLNLSVVAEGVETATQLDLLARMRCDEIQGFYFSQPLPPERFAEVLEAGTLVGKEYVG